jgi:hypothetical protein
MIQNSISIAIKGENANGGTPPPPGVWILATGFWNDSGEWVDSDNWID